MEDKIVNTFDIDGVLYMNKDFPKGVGINAENSVIVTGRSWEESEVTFRQLEEIGIVRPLIYFNQVPFDQKTRETSGQHKGNIIKWIMEENPGYVHGYHFEDDPIQIAEIKKIVPNVRIVHLVHEFTEKENVRHE